MTRDRLISLISAPLIWAGHFLLCYVWVSLACAFGWKAIGTPIAIFTLLALTLLAYTGWVNYRKWTQTRHSNPPDADLRAFFALNSMMLCGVSAIALIWVAFPAALLPPCVA
ncbi:MAG TPA: hypothetical protein VGE12_10160 [Noviherbaspirillum sp.]